MVLERAASLVEEFHSIGQDVQEMEQQIQGRLRIAAPPALDAYTGWATRSGILWGADEFAV